MRKRDIILFFLVSTSIVLLSCSRGGTPDDGNGPHIINNDDSIPPVIVIYTPVPDQLFTSGNSINVTGKITDTGGLYRGSIRITNDANGALLKEQLYEIHGFQLYNFNTSYTTSVTTASNYTVTVSFEDHGTNVTTTSVKVKVNP